MTDNISGPEKKYKFDDCAECGECFAACPYVDVSAWRGAREMHKLREGLGSVFLEKCAGCATCDLHCPRGCSPYALIRTRWHERYRRRGLPVPARFLMPHSKPNFRTAVRVSDPDWRFLKSISKPSSNPVVLYTGCNSLLFPGQLQSKIFDGVGIMGNYDWCCGEMYYRSGLFGHARQAANRLRVLFSGMKIEKMLFVCSACYNMVANIYPNELGVSFDFEKELFTTWLAGRLDNGRIKVRRPLKRSVVVHDPCHAKLIGGDIHDSARRVITAIGGKVVEPEHTKNESLCCGVAAGCSRFNPFDIFSAGAKRLVEFDRSGAHAAAAYCNGCQLTLNTIRQLFPTRVPVYPLIELVQTAIGEKVDEGLNGARARAMLAGIARSTIPQLLNPERRFIMPDIGLLPPL